MMPNNEVAFELGRVITEVGSCKRVLEAVHIYFESFKSSGQDSLLPYSVDHADTEGSQVKQVLRPKQYI